MKRNPKIINTEIGELICLEKHGSHKNFVTLLSEGQTSDYYSQGIGLVIFENYGLPYSLKHHYRLVDYHIE